MKNKKDILPQQDKVNKEGFTFSQYQDYQKSLINDANTSQDSLDKLLITLTSSGIAIALLVIKEILSSEKPIRYSGCLEFSIILWVLGLLCALGGYMAAIRKNRNDAEKIANTRWSQAPENFIGSLQTNSYCFITICNWLHIFLFIIGLVLFSIFMLTNLHNNPL